MRACAASRHVSLASLPHPGRPDAVRLGVVLVQPSISTPSRTTESRLGPLTRREARSPSFRQCWRSICQLAAAAVVQTERVAAAAAEVEEAWADVLGHFRPDPQPPRWAQLPLCWAPFCSAGSGYLCARFGFRRRTRLVLTESSSQRCRAPARYPPHGTDLSQSRRWRCAQPVTPASSLVYVMSKKNRGVAERWGSDLPRRQRHLCASGSRRAQPRSLCAVRSRWPPLQPASSMYGCPHVPLPLDPFFRMQRLVRGHRGRPSPPSRGTQDRTGQLRRSTQRTEAMGIAALPRPP